MTLRNSVCAVACFMTLASATYAGTGQFMPNNDLYLEDDIERKDANMTEEKFNEVVDQVINYYAPIAKKHGGDLVSKKAWKDSTVNAYATQSGATWTVAMFGGLARRPEVTADGFSLVVCHELGHHLAGFPFKSGSNWASSEGESDYFATQSCGREIWRDDAKTNAGFRERADGTVKDKCDRAWKNAAEQNLCYRLAYAGIELANLLAALDDEKVSVDTPETSEVSTTDTNHPKAQCRMDTYFQGSLCDVSFDISVIPGRKHPSGQSSKEAEEIAKKYSCWNYGENNLGARPRCWFKPRI